jgi:uncharacterized cupredoxin-like copper-binding protein
MAIVSRPLVALLLTAALALVASACGTASAANATVGIHYSRFEPGVITARAGEPVTVTLRNDDPIDHEWIVGPPQVHARHRVGSEPYHAERPTVVTVPAFSTRVTAVTFDEARDYAYICHLPGHESYGMVGTLRVV